MKIKSLHGYGSHLTIDGYGCDKDSLNDISLIENILIELPKKIKMKIISDPLVKNYEAKENEESGVTGIILLAESHISIHTYPKKRYVAIDIFSCNEFNVEEAIDYLKNKFSIKKIEKNIIPRGYEHEYDDSNLEKVKGFDIYKIKNAKDFVSQFENVGFQSTHLGKAIKIIKKMKKENAKIFLTFTSNMVTSGLREIFAYLVKEKFVDVIITSTGSIEEDLMKSNKPFLLGDFNANDIELHKKGINRVGNIYIPDERYAKLEDVLIPFFGKMNKLQEKNKKMISPSDLIFELGKETKDKNSILFWATKNNIPIFCPGITDGALGLQLYFFKQKNPGFGIDVTADMDKLAKIVLNADKTAGILLGGGIAKHHAIGVNILREGFDYVVYVTTATQYDGSLSGARTNEAVSWNKIKEDANAITVEGDATIIFPLIVAGVLEWCIYLLLLFLQVF